MSTEPPDDFERTVREDAPYFRRLDPILRRIGFTVAAYVTEHQKHQLANETHSDCDECKAAATPALSTEALR